MLTWGHLRWGPSPVEGRAPAAGRPTRRKYSLLLLVWAALLVGCGRDPLHAIDELQARGRTEPALRIAEDNLRRLTPGDPLYWRLALRKAQLLEALNQRPEALAWLAALRRDHSVPGDFGILLHREQAAIETALGKFRDAEEHLATSIAAAHGARQARMEASLEIRRAYVWIQLDRLDEAEQSLARADAYARESGDHSLDPYALNYQGLVRNARNRFEDAIGPLEQSLAGFQREKQSDMAANVMLSLAASYYRLGRFDKALALDQRALSLVTPDDRHLVLGQLGNVFLDQHDSAQAINYYKQAVALARGRKQNFEAKWLNNLVLALIDRGRWDEAEKFNREAAAVETGIDSLEERAMTEVSFGRIELRKRNYVHAREVLVRVAEERRNPPAVLDAYAYLADLYNQMGEPAEARRQFDTALRLADEESTRLTEDENKLSYLAALIDLHREYAGFLMDRGDKAGAFAVAESSRARLLRERLDLPQSALHGRSIAEYQAAARRSGATFLAYWIGPEGSYVWVISPSRFDAYLLPPEREIGQLVEQYQASFENGGSPRSDVGAKLFQLLLGQLPGVIQPGARYLIVPDGPLYALNFETLPVPGEHPHFWIEDATVAVAPSLELLVARHVERPRDRSLLLIGDASEWTSEYPKLLYAAKEMEGIEGRFSAIQRTVLRGPAATPAAYQRSRPGQYAYIHFAAHATANKNSPLDSSIILSPDSTGGKLSVKQVLANPVHAELVTISACHSAGARTYWGEGLVGFAWAFLQSGAHSVIAGLWDVSDYSSPRLMSDLYAGLAASMSPSDALRAAKLQLIRGGKYANPYYWGAFQLYEGALYDSRPSVASLRGVQ